MDFEGTDIPVRFWDEGNVKKTLFLKKKLTNLDLED